MASSFSHFKRLQAFRSEFRGFLGDHYCWESFPGEGIPSTSTFPSSPSLIQTSQNIAQMGTPPLWALEALYQQSGLVWVTLQLKGPKSASLHFQRAWTGGSCCATLGRSLRHSESRCPSQWKGDNSGFLTTVRRVETRCERAGPAAAIPIAYGRGHSTPSSASKRRRRHPSQEPLFRIAEKEGQGWTPGLIWYLWNKG